MASGPGVEIDTTSQLGQSFFFRRRRFWVKCSGNGDVFVNLLWLYLPRGSIW